MVQVVAFSLLAHWKKKQKRHLGMGIAMIFIKQQQMLSLQFSPSDWDLLRKRVLALGWSDGLASWARSVKH